MILLIYLLCLGCSSISTEKCGFDASLKDMVCDCYPASGHIACIDRGIQKFPDFTELKGQYWYLDISKNKIQSLQNLDSKGVKAFKFIIVLDNPLLCKTIPPWTSLKTDCIPQIKKTTTAQQISSLRASSPKSIFPSEALTQMKRKFTPSSYFDATGSLGSKSSSYDMEHSQTTT